MKQKQIKGLLALIIITFSILNYGCSDTNISDILATDTPLGEEKYSTLTPNSTNTYPSTGTCSSTNTPSKETVDGNDGDKNITNHDNSNNSSEKVKRPEKPVKPVKPVKPTAN